MAEKVDELKDTSKQISGDEMVSVLESNVNTVTGLLKDTFDQLAKGKSEITEEKSKWEEEKVLVQNTMVFHERKIELDVGGVRYSTSISTLTRDPDSMLGAMFSGRHDLKSVQCSDGSYFIDRDGTHFRTILNYLRDGEKVSVSFPKSSNDLQELMREAEFYQLRGLVAILMPVIQERYVISQNEVNAIFISGSGSCCDDYGRKFNVSYASNDRIVYQNKNLKGVSFSNIRFSHPVLFTNCNLRKSTFSYCIFESEICFENCRLDGASFNCMHQFVSNCTFTGTNTDNVSFEDNLKSELQSAAKIN